MRKTKSTENFTVNPGYNILRLFVVLPRAYSSCFKNAIFAHMRLPFFNFFFKFSTFLLKSSNILPFFAFFAIFLKIARMPLLS